MCGRFTLQVPVELLVEIFNLTLSDIEIMPRYNIAPTQRIAVIRQDADQQNHLAQLRWGLVPSWVKELKGPLLINARSETISDKPAFRQAIRYRRCLIPASGFFEWRQEGKAKLPRYIQLKGALMVFAGIWESWKSPEEEVLESCAILTTSANSLVAGLHDRQPVILYPSDFNLWLDRHTNDPVQLKHLYRPYPADLMELYPVSTLVNVTKNQGPDLIAPEQESLFDLAP
jgi:putative SOS response-associated peptidase YedK